MPSSSRQALSVLHDRAACGAERRAGRTPGESGRNSAACPAAGGARPAPSPGCKGCSRVATGLLLTDDGQGARLAFQPCQGTGHSLTISIVVNDLLGLLDEMGQLLQALAEPRRVGSSASVLNVRIAMRGTTKDLTTAEGLPVAVDCHGEPG